jgi:hypothetical protein
MRGWSSSQNAHLNDGVAASSQPRPVRTPTRPRVGLHNRDSPRRKKDPSILPGPSTVPKGADGALPGFINSFAATPSRRSLRKGKQLTSRAAPAPVAETPARSWRGGSREPPSPPSSPTPVFVNEAQPASVLPVAKDERMSSSEFEAGAMDVDAANTRVPRASPIPAAGEPSLDASLTEDMAIDPVVWREEVSEQRSHRARRADNDRNSFPE